MSTHSQASFGVGDMIADRYVVFDVGTQGQHGTLYEARDVTTQKWVVASVLPAGSGPFSGAGFLAGLDKVAALEHPHIVSLLARELLPGGERVAVRVRPDGGSLAEILRDGPIRGADGKRVVVEIAQALAYAHAEGIIHRGLSTHSVFLVSQGLRRNVHVADFIVSFAAHGAPSGRFLAGGGDDPVPVPSRFLAPEVLRGDGPTEASDVFAWGLVAYEVLTGTPAITAGSIGECIKAAQRFDFTPLPASVDEHLRAVLEQALAFKPTDRFAHAQSLLEALQRDKGAPLASARATSFDRTPTKRARQESPFIQSLKAKLEAQRSGQAEEPTAGGPIAPPPRPGSASISQAKTVDVQVLEDIELTEVGGDSPPPPPTHAPSAAPAVPRSASRPGAPPGAPPGLDLLAGPTQPTPILGTALSGRADNDPTEVSDLIPASELSEVDEELANASTQVNTPFTEAAGVGGPGLADKTVEQDLQAAVAEFDAELGSAASEPQNPAETPAARLRLSANALNPVSKHPQIQKSTEESMLTLLELLKDGEEKSAKTTPLKPSVWPKAIAIAVLVVLIAALVVVVVILAGRRAGGPASSAAAESDKQTPKATAEATPDEAPPDPVDEPDEVGTSVPGDGAGATEEPPEQAGADEAADGVETPPDGSDTPDATSPENTADAGDTEPPADVAVPEVPPVTPGVVSGLPDACQGRLSGCVSAGRAALAAGDPATALDLFEEACNRDHLEACTAAAQELAADRRNKKRLDRIYPMASKACAAGLREDCVVQANMMLFGDGTRRDSEGATALLRATCDGGSTSACFVLAELTERGKGVEKSIEGAAALFEKACQGKHADGCARLAEMYRSGKGVKSSHERYVALLLEACEAGKPDFCFEAGEVYRRGRGIGEDLPKALEHYEAGCERGSGEACERLCYIHQFGQGVPEDVEKALTFCDKGCVASHTKACYRASVMVTTGIGGSTGAARLETYLEGACKGGEKKACQRLKGR